MYISPLHTTAGDFFLKSVIQNDMALRLKDILAERKRAQTQQGKQAAEIDSQPTQAVPPPNYVPHREADIWELAGLF